jgi:hypothetical protein
VRPWIFDLVRHIPVRRGAVGLEDDCNVGHANASILEEFKVGCLASKSGMEGLAQTATKLFAGVVIICLCSFVDRGEFLFERTKRKGSKLVNKPERRGLVVRKKTEGSTLANQGSNNRNLICGARNEGRWKRERKASQCVECSAHRRCWRPNDKAH